MVLAAYAYILGCIFKNDKSAQSKTQSQVEVEKPFVWFETTWEDYLDYRDQVSANWRPRSFEENRKAKARLAPRNYQNRDDFEHDSKLMRMFRRIDYGVSIDDPRHTFHDTYGPFCKKKYR